MTAFQDLLTLERAFILRDPQKESNFGKSSGGASSFIHSNTFWDADEDVASLSSTSMAFESSRLHVLLLLAPAAWA
jgi:hypothetical protein